MQHQQKHTCVRHATTSLHHNKKTKIKNVPLSIDVCVNPDRSCRDLQMPAILFVNNRFKTLLGS